MREMGKHRGGGGNTGGHRAEEAELVSIGLNHPVWYPVSDDRIQVCTTV